MSHAPETSLSSREIARYLGDRCCEPLFDWEKVAEIIDAWVRVREAEVLRDKLVDLLPRLQGHYSVLRDFQVQLMQAEIEDAESALAAARKQLEETR